MTTSVFSSVVLSVTQSSVVKLSLSLVRSLHTQLLKAEIYVLSKDEGGRHTPFFDGYRPQFFFGTADVTGVISCPEGVEMVMPGDNLSITIELGKAVAMEAGQRFAIREGGRTIGAGRITEVTK